MTKKNIPKLASIKPGQKIGMEIDEKKSLKMFVTNLYKSKSVMAQETYSNELTAAMVAKEMGHNPWIEVTTNIDERTLVIQGCDSLGITPTILTDIATVLGSSGNTDGKKPGMFGVGFAAWLGISNTMILSSLPIETGEQYDLVFAGSMENKPIDAPDLEHTGTRIRITLMPNVDMTELVSHLVKCAEFASIPTFLINERPLDDSLGAYGKPGKHELERHTHEQYIQSIRENKLKNSGEGAILGGAVLHVKGKNFEFTGLYHPEGSVDSDDSKKPHRVFTLNIPISAEIDIPDDIGASILNVTDATKLKPTPDRERLDDAAQKSINAELTNLINTNLSQFNIKTMKDFMTSPHPKLYIRKEPDEPTLPWYDGTTTLLSGIIGRIVMVHPAPKYRKNVMSYFYEAIGEEYEKGKKLPIAIIPEFMPSASNEDPGEDQKIVPTKKENEQDAWLAKVFEKFGDHIMVSFPDNKPQYDSYKALLKKLGGKPEFVFPMETIPRKARRKNA